MKNLYTKCILALLLILSNYAFAQSVTEKYFVSGECEMCKDRIEKNAKIAGADVAKWNSETKYLEVVYDSSKSSKEKILKTIADVGHDNELHNAQDSVYDKLPGCCHYERLKKPDPSKKENEFFVRGNCGSCKARIEKAAKDAGATFAFWNAETQTVQLQFDSNKTSSDSILKKIAKVGHDTDEVKATDEDYEKLHGCCMYERK